MKNRSNIVASILTNGDILEQVREASANEYFSSADEELSKYLDSIEGKVAQFQNRLQELISTTIDSSWIKGIVDFGTKAIEVITSLADAFGGLNMIVGTVFGVFSNFKDIGFLSFDRKSGKFSNIFQKFGQSASKSIGTGVQQNLVPELEKAFTRAGGSTIDLDTFIKGSEFNTLSSSAQKYVQGLANASTEAMNLSQALGKAKEQQAELEKQASSQSQSGGSKLISGLKSLGGTVLSTVINAGLSMAISAVLGAAINTISNYVNRREIAIQKGQEAQSKISDIRQQYDQKRTYQEDSLDNYLKLRESVDYTNQGISNRELSTEKYQEFLSLNQQMANLFPSLVSGFDSQGNAILTLDANADKAKESIAALLEEERQLADFQIGEQLGTALKGFQVRYEELQKDIARQTDIADTVKGIQDTIKAGKTGSEIDISKLGLDENGTLRWNYDPNDPSMQKVVDQITKMYVDAANSIYKNVDYSASDSTAGRLVLNLADATEENVEEFEKTFKAAVQSADLGSLPEEYIKALSTKKSDMAEVKADWNALVPSLISQMNLYEDYQKLGDLKVGEQLQQIIADDITNLDLEGLSEDDWNLLGDDPRAFLRKRFLDPLVAALADSNGEISKVSEDNAKKLLDAFSDKSLNTTEYRNNFAKVLREIVPGDDDESYKIRQNIRVMLGLTYVDEKTGRDFYSDSADLDSLAEELGISSDEVRSISLEDIDLVQEAKINGKFDYEGSGLEDFLNWLEKYKEARKEIQKVEPTDNLSSIFNDEDYAQNAQSFETSLSSLTGALESLRENGTLTADEMKTLQESFPDLTEFTEKAISDKAVGKLTDWIKELRANVDGMSAEGLQQLNTYIENLVSSMGNLADESSDVKDLFMDLNAPADVNTATHAQREGLSKLFDSQIADLQEKLGDEELNWNVVYQMVASDQFSGTADEILAKYKDMKMVWEIDADTAKIQAELERLDSDTQKRRSELEYKEAKGDIITQADYDGIIRNAEETIRLNQEDVSNKRQKRNKIYDTSSPAYKAAQKALNESESALAQSQIDLINLQTEQLEAGTNAYQRGVDLNKTEINKLENLVAKNEKSGQRTTKKTYDSLQELYQNTAEQEDTMARYWEDAASRVTSDATRAKYLGYANEHAANAQTAREQAFTYSSAYSNDELKQLGYELDEYKAEAQEINDTISVKQAQGLKVTEKEYKALQTLSKNQISNLRTQNKLLAEEAAKTGTTADRRREIGQEIDANNSAISSLLTDITNYDNTIKNLVISDAQALSSAISSAMSEMTTETGLSSDTIQQLTTQFSNLANEADISSVFYATADGVKVDMIELQRLAEQQNEIINQDFASKIEEIQEAIDRASKAGDTSKVRELNEQMAEYMRQQAQYYATYAEQMQNFSRLVAIARADQTKNEGADYETAQGYMKTAKEMFDKGLIGTDDFKTRAAYLDPYGRTDWKNFEQNYKKAERYFTDDASGVSNFLNDLVSKGLATYDALTGYSLDFADSAKAALEMGMSDEFFMDMMGRINDYGGNIAYVSSLEEASAKASDLKTQLTDAQLEYAQLVAAGASEDVLAEKRNQIQGLKDDLTNLDTATNNYVAGSQQSFIEGFKNLPDTVDALRQAYATAENMGDQVGMKRIMDEVQRMADEYGIKINLDTFEIDRASYEAAADQLGLNFGERFRKHAQEEIGKSLEQASLSGKSGTLLSNMAERGQDYLSIVDKLVPGLDQTDSKVNQILTTLRDADTESLSKIVFGDGALAEGDAGAIETALDGLISELGLAQSDGDLLLQVLKDILGYEDTQINVDTNMEEASAEIERGTALLKGMQAAGKINVSFDMSQDPTTITDRNTLESHRQELVTVKTQLDPNTQQSAIAALDSMIEKYDTQIHIQTILDGATDAQAKLLELQTLAQDKDAFTAYVNATLGAETSMTEAEIEQMRASLQEMSASDYPITVKIADDQMSQLTSAITDPTMDIHAQKAEDFDSVVAAAEEQVTGAKPVMNIRANNAPAIREANATSSYISALTPSITVGANTSGISTAISNALTGPFSIKINATVVGMPKANGSFVTGTMVAHSTGTAHNVLNYKPISAYAMGRNVTVGRDEDALVGELSPNKPESIVRDGKWMILPGGPHVEHLKKNDIVFSAQQTEDLLKHGRTGTPGHLIGARALATGTLAYNGMPSYDSGKGGWTPKPNTPGATTPGSGSGKDVGKIAQDTGKKVTSSVEDAAKKSEEAIQKAIEDFQKATKDWFNLAEITLEKTNREIERLMSQSELATTTREKNGFLGQAYKLIEKQISNNTTAEKNYRNQASKVRQQAIDSGLVSATEADQIIAQLNSGSLDITSYNEGIRTFIESYRQWTEAAEDCVDANIDLKKQLKDIQATKLDNIVSKYGTLAERSSAIQASTKAMLEYYQASGGEDREVIRQNMGSQIVRQKEIVKYNEQAMKDYEKELEKAAKIYGVNSKEYQEAQTQLAQLTQEYWESKTSLVELQKAAKNAATELAQAQFDKADAKWGGLLHMVQSSQKVTQSKEAYYTATGTRANSGTFKQLYNQERVRLEEQQKYLSSQYTEYTKILSDLEAAGKKNTDEYHEAKAKLFDLEASIWDTNTAIVEMGDKIKQLDIDAIGQAIERLSRFSSALKGIAGYYEKVGTRKNFPSVDVSTMQKSIAQRRTAYQGQIDTNNLEIVQIDKQSAAIAEQMKQWEPGSDKWNEGYAKLQQLRETAISLATANLELSEAIRKTRWEPFERIQRIIKETVSDFEHLNSLISDAEIFDTGDQIEITEEGYAKLALYGAEIQNYNQLIANERGALEKLHDEYDAGIISMEQYEEESRQHIETIQQSVSANEQLKKSIIDVYKTQITNENRALQELIDLRKKSLSAKKSYYDYNRTLQGKNKELQQLRAEAAALTGVQDAATKARLAQINAQISEKEDDLADTRYQHSIDMQQQGYDELSNKAQKNLDDTLKYVEGNAEAQEQVVAMMLKRVEKNYDSAYSAIQAKIKQTGTVVGKTAEKQIADLNGTLAPLQAWATQVQENEGTLSSFQTQWETVVDNISTNPIRFMTVGAQEALENLGLLTTAMKEYRSAYEEMVGGLEANGQQKTSYTDADDKKKAEQAAGGETAAQAKARRDTLTKMYNYAASRKVADTTVINNHKDDALWNYLYKLTGGKDASATEMAHLAQYLRDLGADLEGVPYKSKVTKEEDLSMDARNKILAAMKQYGFGTNQGAGQYIYSRNRTPSSGTVTQKQSDVLWKYIYDTTGQDLTEAEMLHIGKAYTNVSGLPTEASGKKLTDAQKKAIVTALQYNGFDLEGYVLSANYGKNLASTTSFKSDNKTTKITASNAATTSSGNITSDIKKAEEQNLKEYIKGITGKTPTDKELVQLAVDQKISGVTANQKSLNETQAAALLKKLKDTGWKSSKKGYTKGTTSIPYTGSHWTHSGELLVRKDGAYLTPLSKGDGVIPANLTENLMKWGAIDPSSFLMKMGKVPTANNTSNTTYNNSYESLLTVYGDVDKEALPELQEILKRACDYTNKYNAREARKLGRK